MLDLVELLLTFSIVQGAYALVSGFLWFVHSHYAYRYQFLLCFGLTLNFITQGIFDDNHLLLALSLGFYFISSISLVHILLMGLDIEVSTKKFLSFLGAMLLLSLGLHVSFEKFILTALPVSLSVSMPMLFYGGKVLRMWKSVSYAHRFYTLLIIINGIHFLDYPFLRLNPEASLLGFTIAFGMGLIFSIFLPAFITNELQKKHRLELENEVLAKTKHLNTTLINLRDAYFQLKESKEEKSQLVNILCHDLATPLSGMNLLLQKVDSEVGDKPEISRLRKMMKHVIMILKEVREMRSHEFGKRDLELSKVRFDDVVESLQMIFEEQLKEKELELKVIKEPESPEFILGDFQILSNNIVANLVSNAIKYSPRGERIDLGIQGMENEGVCLFVRDYGEGLSKDDLEKIRQKNYKPLQGTSGEKGFGLGLSIVHFYLQRLGGSFEVESKTQEESPQDHGTTVYLYLKSS